MSLTGAGRPRLHAPRQSHGRERRRDKGAELTFKGRDTPSKTRVGCIDRTEFGQSLRCTLRKISDQISGNVQPSGESVEVSQPMRGSKVSRSAWA